jgi:hypothetical protein
VIVLGARALPGENFIVPNAYLADYDVLAAHRWEEPEDDKGATASVWEGLTERHHASTGSAGETQGRRYLRGLPINEASDWNRLGRVWNRRTQRRLPFLSYQFGLGSEV